MADTLTIDPELAALCGKLSAEELSLLESQLDRDGCLDPIILWANHDDTILDGHHRYDICQRLGIAFKTKSLRIETREEVIEWIACHQLGRRNASDETKDYLRGKRYRAEKKEHGGDRKSDESSGQNVHHSKKTAERLANEYGVDEKTVRRDAAFAESVDRIAEVAGPEVKAKILSGQSGLSKKDVVAIAELPAREQKAAIKAVVNGQPAVLPEKPSLISDTFYKSLKGLVERIEGIREQYGTVKQMFSSDEWRGSDTQFVIELVHELCGMFSELDKEMQDYAKGKEAKLRKGSRKRATATA